jgi:4-hydroxy-tetrahydrodipicolinate synthase
MQATTADTNPIPIKAVLAMMGLMEEACRLPLISPSASLRQRLAAVIEELGIRAQGVGQ